MPVGKIIDGVTEEGAIEVVLAYVVVTCMVDGPTGGGFLTICNSPLR